MSDKEKLPTTTPQHEWEIVEMADGRKAKRCKFCWYAYEFGYDMPCPHAPRVEGV